MSIGKRTQELTIQGKTYHYYAISTLFEDEQALTALPYAIRILLEGALRRCNGETVTEEHIRRLCSFAEGKTVAEVPFMPSRIILQDFTGVPAVVDLAAMRDEAEQAGLDPTCINPEIPVDLIIDHSVMVDYYGDCTALDQNIRREFERNKERYQFLKWAQNSFDNFSVLPPAQGIIHQINLEKLATVVMEKEEDGRTYLYPDTLVGTDSHTTMINGLGVVGWGVGGIEAEAAMLGQPVYMLLPEVVGVELIGRLKAGVTATDLTLRLTELLRQHQVVGKFIEYFGEGAQTMPLTNRATIANMAPEYGATMGYFPVDEETLDYLRLTGRPKELVDKVGQYYQANHLFRRPESPRPNYSQVLTLDLATIKPALAGPKRPQDRLDLAMVAPNFYQTYSLPAKDKPMIGSELTEGSVVLAAITSCTNTSNPQVMLAAGLVAKKAVERGLKVPWFVKTSLTPGSRRVSRYLEQSGLLPYLEELGFFVAGYGCATCIGNSGPLAEQVSKVIQEKQLVVAGVLSGNRNFEGRIHSDIQANYLASPPLVVAYALAGTVLLDIERHPIGYDQQGQAVKLADLWPTEEEVSQLITKYVTAELYKEEEGVTNHQWLAIEADKSATYPWQSTSTYVRQPDFFKGLHRQEIIPTGTTIRQAKVLAYFGDSITTDHISPAGAIGKDSPAGQYLINKGLRPIAFNSFGSRRGNHEVMMRGTFGNIRIKNRLADGKVGGYTRYKEQILPIFEAAELYQSEGWPLIILAGKEYGTGSSRDWAAKGPYLQGVKAVCAESYERIHRNNLIGMGILPLQFLEGQTAETLGLTGREKYDFFGLETLQPLSQIRVVATDDSGRKKEFELTVRLDNLVEVGYYCHGGILHKVLIDLFKQHRRQTDQ